MTREEIIEQLDSIVGTYEILLGNGVNSDILDVDDIEVIREAISALSAEPCREADDYENEIADLHNRLDISEYDKERYKEEITILEAKNKGEWIPISERLPKERKAVLCWAESTAERLDTEFIGMLDTGDWFLQSDANHLSFPHQYKVVAWMPLPEPYKADMRGEIWTTSEEKI